MGRGKSVIISDKGGGRRRKKGRTIVQGVGERSKTQSRRVYKLGRGKWVREKGEEREVGNSTIVEGGGERRNSEQESRYIQ